MLGEFEELTDEITVKIRTYGVLETMLNLSINRTDVEIFSVEADDTGFTICSRRFGHGVGMSQRGAQTMAGAYEKTAEDILTFYYPGMALYRIDWQEKALTRIEALPESVGHAAPSPTPEAYAGAAARAEERRVVREGQSGNGILVPERARAARERRRAFWARSRRATA